MITMTITAQNPEELYSTIKGCAVLISEDCPSAMPPDENAPASNGANPTPAPAATPANGMPQSAPSMKAIPVPVQISPPPVGRTDLAQSTVPAPTALPVPPVATVPTAPPPTPAFTYEAVAKAGAELVAARPDLMPALLGLLQKYGVQAVTELKPEQLGPFAAELRQQGAKI